MAQDLEEKSTDESGEDIVQEANDRDKHRTDRSVKQGDHRNQDQAKDPAQETELGKPLVDERVFQEGRSQEEEPVEKAGHQPDQRVDEERDLEEREKLDPFDLYFCLHPFLP